MYTMIISALVAAAIGAVVWQLTGGVVFGVLVFTLLFFIINLLASRYFMKHIQSVMQLVEKDVRGERYEAAIDRLKDAYKYGKWQFMMKKNIDAQIGTLYYIRKQFDDALPYLKNGYVKNWSAMSMLAAHHYRLKEYSKAYSVMDKAIAANSKEGFVYSLYAFFLSEQKNVDKAISVLNKGVKKLPLDEKIENHLEALKNGKKIKMQSYGPYWLQLHLGKSQEGAKQYQSFLANQRVRRR